MVHSASDDWARLDSIKMAAAVTVACFEKHLTAVVVNVVVITFRSPLL